MTEFPNKRVNVAIRDINYPVVEKTLTFQLYAGHVLDKFSEANFKYYTVNYRSMSELCLALECTVNKLLTFEVPT